MGNLLESRLRWFSRRSAEVARHLHAQPARSFAEWTPEVLVAVRMAQVFRVSQDLQHQARSLELCELFWNATSTLWPGGFMESVMRLEVPDHEVRGPFLPENPSLWIAALGDESGQPNHYKSILLEENETRVRLIRLGSVVPGAMRRMWEEQRDGEEEECVDIEIGKPAPSDPFVRGVLAALYFIRSSFPRPSMRVRRAARRKIEHAIERPPAMDSRFIDLRRYGAPNESSVGTEAARAWTCQWLVSGHLRHCPSGVVTFVSPHVKGPDDMPFRERPRRVIR